MDDLKHLKCRIDRLAIVSLLCKVVFYLLSEGNQNTIVYYLGSRSTYHRIIMGLFKSKKSPAASKEDGNSSIPTSTVDGHGRQQRKRKKFSPFRKSKPPERASAESPREPVEDPSEEQRDNPKDAHDEDDDIGDIPRSISAPSREGDGDGGREDDQDSIGSPGAMFVARNNERAARLREMLTEGPASIERLRHYVAALSPSVSPDPSAELPSWALRCLFSLSEHSSQKEQRIHMVRASCAPSEEEKEEWVDDDGDAPPLSLVPALLSFLQRCPRDSSEQYLTLLVLNNLSIPTQNKRLIGLEHGGAKALGGLLCEDPGCHLLVIIVVNLTFGDNALNRDLLRVRSGESEKEWDVQLVDSLSYALLVSP